jgi:hypothetical protein
VTTHHPAAAPSEAPGRTDQKSSISTVRRDGCWVLPVGENDRPVGMLTDRDIAIRAVAQDRGPDTKVRGGEDAQGPLLL